MRHVYQRQLATLTETLAEACGMSGRAMERATRALLDADLDAAQAVILGDEDITALTGHAEENAFVLLALQAPVAGDLRAVVSAIQIAADVRRMGALAVHVAKIARLRHPHHAVPAEVRPHLEEMGRCAVELGSNARHALMSPDARRAAQIPHDDDEIDELHRRLLEVLMDRRWSHGVAAAVDVALLSRFYERYADHAVLIARRIIFQATGQHDPIPTAEPAR
jgi:phosphate transport system protein